MEGKAQGEIFIGARGPYQWLTSTGHYIRHLVRLCPDVFVGRFLTVTSIDSGKPWLTEVQRASGWELRSGLAYSSRIKSIDELFYQRDGDDSPGFDEWYLFDSAPEPLGERLEGNPFEPKNMPRPGRLLVFVNRAAFILHENNPSVDPFIEMFWEQMSWIRPDVYISDGRDNLTFVCRETETFELVERKLRANIEVGK